jgi:hypothetical protein
MNMTYGVVFQEGNEIMTSTDMAGSHFMNAFEESLIEAMTLESFLDEAVEFVSGKKEPCAVAISMIECIEANDLRQRRGIGGRNGRISPSGSIGR